MKKTLLSIGCLAAAIAASAQVAHWVYPPQYDALKISADGKYLLSDSAGVSKLSTLDGKLIYSTPELISPFHEGLAVILNRTNNEIAGFIDEQGKFTALDGGSPAYNYPYFSEGLLLFKKGDDYGYYKTDGSQAKTGKVERAYPLSMGYAPQYGYAQSMLKIKKVPCFYYINEGGSQMSFFLDDDMVQDKDVIFASSIPADGKSVVIIKNKLYWFDSNQTELTPMYGGSGDDATVQMSIDKNQMGYFAKLPAGPVQFVANYGKGKTATLSFDEILRPVKFAFEDSIQEFATTKPAASPKMDSELSREGKSAPFGLAYKGHQIIEPQFQDVAATYGKCALVKLNDKWGIMEVVPTPNISIAFNNGEELPFRHATASADLVISLPESFPTRALKIAADSASGFTIVEESRRVTAKNGTNFVTYTCDLQMPANLGVNMTDLSYPLYISYEGAELPGDTIDVKAWRVNYFTVDPIAFGTNVENGAVSLAFDVNKHLIGEEQDYPFDVTVSVGQATIVPSKVSENRYRASIPGIAPGAYHIDVNVTEKGCPTISFPFEMNYQAASEGAEASVSLVMADPVQAAPALPMPTHYANGQAPQPDFVAAPYQGQFLTQPAQQQAPQAMAQYAQPAQQQYAQPVQQQYAQPAQQQYAQPVQQQYAQPAQQQYAQPVQQQYAQPAQQQYAQPVQQQYAQPAQQQYAQPVQQQYGQPVQQQYAQPAQQLYVQPAQQQYVQPAQQQYAQPVQRQYSQIYQ